MYDAVHIFAIGLQTLEQSHTLRLSNISCADEKPWDGGLSLINYINAVSTFRWINTDRMHDVHVQNVKDAAYNRSKIFIVSFNSRLCFVSHPLHTYRLNGKVYRDPLNLKKDDVLNLN